MFSFKHCYTIISIRMQFVNIPNSHCFGIGLVNQISYNDRPNAELIMESRKNADLVIRSVDFSS